MGYELWAVELVIAANTEPDWDAVRRKIEAASAAELSRTLAWDWVEVSEWAPDPDSDDPADLERARERLLSHLDEIQNAYEHPREHNALAIEARDLRIFVLGGATAGEDPHPSWDALLNLADTGILFAGGFRQMVGVPRERFEAQS